LIEAAACGRAIVATDVPGCRDVVTQAETGLLIPPKDPAALADALQQLANDPTLRQQLGAAGRARTLARFSNEQVNRETLEVYEKLTAP
jgi:glycosyltransferase involved in cell wall biosynthesis